MRTTVGMAAGMAVSMAVGVALGGTIGRRWARHAVDTDPGTLSAGPRDDRLSPESLGPKARAAGRLAVERVGDGVATRFGWRDADAAADALARDLAAEVASLLHDRRTPPPGTGAPEDGPGVQATDRRRRTAHHTHWRTGSPIAPGPQASSR